MEFKDGVSRKTLGLKGDERIDVIGLQSITPGQDITVRITYGNGGIKEVITRCRIDTATEMDYYRHGDFALCDKADATLVIKPSHLNACKIVSYGRFVFNI